MFQREGESMKSFVRCAEMEERTCPNRRVCIENGVVCVHLIVGFEAEANKGAKP